MVFYLNAVPDNGLAFISPYPLYGKQIVGSFPFGCLFIVMTPNPKTLFFGTSAASNPDSELIAISSKSH